LIVDFSQFIPARRVGKLRFLRQTQILNLIKEFIFNHTPPVLSIMVILGYLKWMIAGQKYEKSIGIEIVDPKINLFKITL
jgi:hypothetical protein